MLSMEGETDEKVCLDRCFDMCDFFVHGMRVQARQDLFDHGVRKYMGQRYLYRQNAGALKVYRQVLCVAD